MVENNKYTLVTEKETVNLHYVSLSSEDEKGWKRISLLNCAGVDTRYIEITFKVETTVPIKDVETLIPINDNTFIKKKSSDCSFLLIHKHKNTDNLDNITNIHLRVTDIENNIVDNWDLEIKLITNIKYTSNSMITIEIKILLVVISVVLLLLQYVKNSITIGDVIAHIKEKYEMIKQ